MCIHTYVCTHRHICYQISHEISLLGSEYNIYIYIFTIDKRCIGRDRWDVSERERWLKQLDQSTECIAHTHTHTHMWDMQKWTMVQNILKDQCIFTPTLLDAATYVYMCLY